MLDYLPVLSLLISVASITLAFVSFKRTKVFQEHEYAPRLQLINEEMVCASPTLTNHPAVTYSAEVENKGLKPVQIDSIWLDYGAAVDAQKRMKYSVRRVVFSETRIQPVLTLSDRPRGSQTVL